MNLEELIEDWESDSTIDSTILDHESLKQPKLHSKWVTRLTKNKVKCFKIEKELAEAKSMLTRYYNGLMDQEELKELGRPQYQYKTPLKTELERLLESDQIVLDIKQRYYYYTILAEYCEDVLKAIRDRGFSIRTAVDWQRFVAGN